MKALCLLFLTSLLAINFGSCWRRRRRRSPPPPPPRVNGGWSGWGGFTPCTKSCGSGTKTQQRWCNNPSPANGGSYCAGSSVNTVSCNTHGCPVHGGWSAWGAFGTCSKSCGGGTRTRPRQCANPPPANGGRNCVGASSESKSCNEHLCPDGPNSPVLVTQGGTKYQLVGCFSNYESRFKTMLITERDKSSSKWNKHLIDWKNWDQYMTAFINRCVQKVTSNNNNKVFGMSYYGECWSTAGVESALELYTKEVSDFSKCVTDGYKQCQTGGTRCIGIEHGIAVYQIIEDFN